jgi:hypothetical protein
MSQIIAARCFSWSPDLFGRLYGRHAGRKRDAAPAGHMCEADRGGIGDNRFHALDRNAERFRRHHRH